MLDELNSPYRKPVTWVRDQIQRETVKFQEEHTKQQQFDLQGRKRSKQKSTRLISEEEYERLKLKGPRNVEEVLNYEEKIERWPEILKFDTAPSPWERQKPVRTLETGINAETDHFVYVHRWPECEKHIPGGVNWLPEGQSPRKHQTADDPDLSSPSLHINVKRWPENKRAKNIVKWDHPATVSRLNYRPFANSYYRKDSPGRTLAEHRGSPPKKDYFFPQVGGEDGRVPLEEELSLTEEELKAVSLVRKKLIEVLSNEPYNMDANQLTDVDDDGFYHDESYESGHFTQAVDQWKKQNHHPGGNLNLVHPINSHHVSPSQKDPNYQPPKFSLFSPEKDKRAQDSSLSPRTDRNSVNNKLKQRNNEVFYSPIPKSPEEPRNQSSQRTQVQGKSQQNRRPRSAYLSRQVKTPTKSPTRKSTGQQQLQQHAARVEPGSNHEFPETRMSPRELRQYKNKLQHPLQTPPLPSATPVPPTNHSEDPPVAQNLIESFAQVSEVKGNKSIPFQKNDENRDTNQKTNLPISSGKSEKLTGDAANNNKQRPKTATSKLETTNSTKVAVNNNNNKNNLNSSFDQNAKKPPQKAIEMAIFKQETNKEVVPMVQRKINNPSTNSTVPAEKVNDIISSFSQQYITNIISSSPSLSKESTLVMKSPNPEQIALIKQSSFQGKNQETPSPRTQAVNKSTEKNSSSAVNALQSPVPVNQSLHFIAQTPLTNAIPVHNKPTYPIEGGEAQNKGKSPFINEIENKQKNYMSPIPSFLSELKNTNLKVQLKKTAKKNRDDVNTNTTTDGATNDANSNQVKENTQKLQEKLQEQKIAYENFLKEMESLQIPQFLLTFHTMTESIPNLSPFASKSNLLDHSKEHHPHPHHPHSHHKPPLHNPNLSRPGAHSPMASHPQAHPHPPNQGNHPKRPTSSRGKIRRDTNFEIIEDGVAHEFVAGEVVEGEALGALHEQSQSLSLSTNCSSSTTLLPRNASHLLLDGGDIPTKQRLSYDSVSLLGRGKFASVYCVTNKETILYETPSHSHPSQAEGNSTNQPKKFARSMINANDLLALKIAQFKDNDLVTTANPAPTIASLRSPQGNNNNNNTSTSNSVLYPSKPIVEEFQREIRSLYDLQKHENIINLIGYSLQPFGIIMDYVAGQNLYVLLHNEHWQKSLTFSSRLHILKDIMAGVTHIHGRQYIHRDIKPHNIIIEQNDEGQIIAAKIVDFGTALKLSFSPENYSNSREGGHEQIGTSGYSAPEIFSSETHTINYAYPADIFSCSIILWEMMISDVSKLMNPLQGLNPHDAYDEMKKGKRPQFFPEYHQQPKEYQELVERCWSFQPDARPRANQILQQLRSFQ